MTDEDEQLRMAVERRRAYRAERAVGLGDVLSRLMENQVAPQQTRFGLITEAWVQMLPSEIYQHSRIVDVSGGRLKVAVDSPSHMYEMQLLSSELLKEFARQCPRARIREIKITIG